jgi:hypothetical protein
MKTLLHRLLILVASSALSIPAFAAVMIERPGLHGRGGGSSPYAVYQGAPATATTAAVPACPIPPATRTGNYWYFDPVNGKSPSAWVTYFAANPSDHGIQGDQQHPWNSLNGAMNGYWDTANVVANVTYPGYTRPLLSSVPFWHVVNGVKVDIADNTGSPPIHPGDTIRLMGGNYGSIFLGGAIATANSSWVWVESVPGQTPVFTALGMQATNNWVFNGITVQSVRTVAPANAALVVIKDGGAALPTSNLIFTGMQLSSAPAATVATWTVANWNTLPRSGFSIAGSTGNGTNGEPNTTCISITNSHVAYANQGSGLAANNILFSNNELDHTVGDMIDWAGSNLAITKNYIHDAMQNGDGNHADGIQGQAGSFPAGRTYNSFFNVLIDSNIVIRRLDPNLAFPSTMQGITQFDADVTNFVVTNNIVVTRSCWGMSYGSDHDSTFAYNTVVDDGDTTILLSGCTTAFNAGGSSHEGPASTNVLVAGNLVDHMDINNKVPGSIIAKNNVALSYYEPFTQYVNGVLVYQVAPGTDANGNTSFAKPGMPYTSVFTNWSPGTLQYDLHPLPGSVARGRGTSYAPLPTIDITGATRTSPNSVGAYQ